MHIVVVDKTSPDRIFADLTEAEWSSYAARYPTDRFDVYRTSEEIYAPGPVPSTKILVDRIAPTLEERVFAIDGGRILTSD